MRRRTLLVAVIAAGALALPETSGAQMPSGDLVSGQAADCNPCFSSEAGSEHFARLEINATSGPSGEQPGGTATIEEDSGTPASETLDMLQVSCLHVVGRTAIVGVTGFEKFEYLLLTVQAVGFIRVTDAGGPDSRLDTFESSLTYSGDPFGEPLPLLPGPTDCSTFPSADDVWHNKTGDLRVVDTTPAPTAKDQCKNGGWRNYGDTFRNQGQCVAFVERGPKP